MTTLELAKAYLRHFHSKSEADFWAFIQVSERCDDPIAGVEIAITLAELCQTNPELSYVAAGPFEDLFKKHGILVVPAFREAGIKSENVRVALSGVWISKDHKNFNHWRDLMIEFKFWGQSSLPLDRGWKPGEPPL